MSFNTCLFSKLRRVLLACLLCKVIQLWDMYVFVLLLILWRGQTVSGFSQTSRICSRYVRSGEIVVVRVLFCFLFYPRFGEKTLISLWLRVGVRGYLVYRT